MGDVTINTTDKRLLEYVSIFGDPIKLNIVFDNATKKTKGIIFCEFENVKIKSTRKKKIIFNECLKKKQTKCKRYKKTDVNGRKYRCLREKSRDRAFYVVKYLDKKEKIKIFWQIKEMLIVDKLLVQNIFTKTPELLKTLFLIELSMDLISIRFIKGFNLFVKNCIFKQL